MGNISPTTLRYIKVLQDLQIEFGSLDNASICEIGVGYGGQCRIICSYFNVKSYTLVDLPQVLGLAKAYLTNYPVSAELKFLTMTELSKETGYDLFISNYAFSELKRSIQNCYYEKAIANSSRGYISYNKQSDSSFKAFSLEDYTKRISNLKVLDEEPLTAEGNKILIWKS